jgi:hypothetical protein
MRIGRILANGLTGALGELGGMVFGLGTIAWFVWVGIVMLRSNQGAAA